MTQRTAFYEKEAAAGAVFVEEAGWLVPGHYGDALAEYRHTVEQATFFDLSTRGKIEVKGKDARRWLHNLCTNDIVNWENTAWREAFLTTNKAKAVAYLVISHYPAKGEEAFSLSFDPGLEEKVLKHLDRYLISEQVELADRTREWAHLHVAGPQANAIFKKISNALPQSAGVDFWHRLFAHDLLAMPGFDWFSSATAAGPMWESLLDAGARPAGSQAYEWLRVEAGIPIFGKEIDEDRFVVEVNRISQTISYTKGCYLGQEPIVMARDRGHVNRKLLGIKIADGPAVPPGAKLFRDETDAGQVTSSVISPRFGPIALAYIRRGHDSPGTKLEVEVEGARRSAEVTGLPFAGSAPLPS
jgi:folate-binding protein YgfZ